MNYETQNSSRHNSASRRKSTNIISAADKLHSLDAKTTGRQRGIKRQAKVSATKHAADAFLRCSFLPKLCVPTSNDGKLERDFNKSLSQLSQYYKIDLAPAKSHGYPHNISFALNEAKEKLKAVGNQGYELRLYQDDEKVFFVSEERFYRGYDLYYIPVFKLYQMLKEPKSRKVSQLLVSVFSYLYRIVDIPYYRQQNSFMFWQYESIGDMLEEEEEMQVDADYINLFKSELEEAQMIGDRIEKLISNPENLRLFEYRTKRFKPRYNFEIEAQKVALQALSIYKDYPETNIFHRIPERKESDEYEDEVLTMDKCISFIASDVGFLFDRLCDYVNADFGEYGDGEDPVIFRHFDGNLMPDENFDFETRIFDLLNKLVQLLDTYQ
ncbi:hypothetical protein [Emticicia fontis]